MPREKGTLPRAYLRIDPNIDQTHEQPGEMLRLICVAARQPRRGRFKNRTALYSVFGQGAAKRALARGDILDHTTPGDCARTPEYERFCTLALPHLYVEGWDEWQESDLEVGARMRRLRAKKRRNAVTPDGPPSAVTALRPERLDAPSPERNAVTTGVRRQASGVPKSDSSSRTSRQRDPEPLPDEPLPDEPAGPSSRGATGSIDPGVRLPEPQPRRPGLHRLDVRGVMR